jgi:hypothetical protein
LCAKIRVTRLCSAKSTSGDKTAIKKYLEIGKIWTGIFEIERNRSAAVLSPDLVFNNSADGNPKFSPLLVPPLHYPFNAQSQYKSIERK